MKRYLLLYILLAFAFITACEDDEDPPVNNDDGNTIAESQLEKLKGKTWSISDASRDDENVAEVFEGFTITFSGEINDTKDNVINGTFSSTNGGQLFPETGQWLFLSSDVQNKLTLANRETDYSFSDNDNTLTLNFNYAGGAENGKVAGIAGEYEFVLAVE
jgi:hypothetical protein